MIKFYGLMAAATFLTAEVKEPKPSGIGKLVGIVFRAIYDFLNNTFANEPSKVSFLAISIILITVVVKMILIPLSIRQAKSTKKMTALTPQLKELQVKYKNDPTTLMNKQRQLYKEAGTTPMSGCLLMLIQLPIIIGLFRVLQNPVSYVFPEPGMYEAMNKAFLWIPNLDLKDPYFFGLPLIAAAATFLQSRIMSKGAMTTDPQQESMAKTMSYIGPVMIFVFAMRYPAGLALYWSISNIITVLQQILVNRSNIGGEAIKETTP